MAIIDSTVVYHTDAIHRKVKWCTVSEVIQDERYVYIEFWRGHSIWIPKIAFPNRKDLDELVRLNDYHSKNTSSASDDECSIRRHKWSYRKHNNIHSRLMGT